MRYMMYLRVLLGSVLLVLLGSTAAAEPAVVDREADPAPVHAAEPGPVHADEALLLTRSAPAQHHLHAAHEALHRYRIDTAHAHLDTLAAHSDGYWAAPHGRALVALFQAFITEEDTYFEQVETHANALRDALNQAPDSGSPWIAHMQGEADLMRALVAAREGSYIRAAWRARSAFRTLRRNTERYPDFAESRLGVGLMRYTIGVLPGRYQRVLRVIGFQGDAERGLADLHNAAEASTVNAVFAEAATGLMRNAVERDTDAAIPHLATAYERYPDSPLWAYVYGFALMENRQVDRAYEVLAHGLEQVEAGAAPVSFLHFFRGRVAFAREDYRAAQDALRTYIDRHAGRALMPPAHLYLGLATELVDGWEAAQPYYEQVSDDREFDEDAALERWAERRLQGPMSEVDRALLAARNAYDAAQYETALERLRALLSQHTLCEEQRAEAHYRKGRVYQAQRAFNSALAHYASARSHTDRASNAQWGAWSWYHAGTVYREQRRPGVAAHAFEAAMDWPTPYDYHEGLHQAARIALSRL